MKRKMKIVAFDLGATFALATNMPALRRWGQREYLEAVCGGERSVLCEVNKQGRLFSYGSSDDSVHLPLRSVLDALSAAADEEPGAQQLYVAQTPVDELGSRLREGKCSSPLRAFFRSLTAAAAQTSPCPRTAPSPRRQTGASRPACWARCCPSAPLPTSTSGSGGSARSRRYTLTCSTTCSRR